MNIKPQSHKPSQNMPSTQSTVFPLSQRQMMIWTGQKLHPEAPLYNMVRTFGLTVALDVDAFSKAFQQFIDHCDAWRSFIVEENGIPQQQLQERITHTVHVVDLADEANPAAAADLWIEERSQQLFDLSGCLFDTALLKLGDTHYIWYLNQHHLIVDAWSASLVLRTVGEFYTLACQNRLESAPPLPAYQDFVQFEQKILESPEAEQAAQFWANKCQKLYEPLDFYGQRPTAVSTRTDRCPQILNGKRAERLAAFIKQPGIAMLSPHLTMLRFFNTVLFATLHRISGHQQIAIGTPFHNRQTPRFKETVGLFMNLFPIQVDIEPTETMTTLMERVGRELFEGMRYAQFPIKDGGDAAAYEVVLNYIHAQFDAFGSIPAQTEWVHCQHGDSNHALRLQVFRNQDGDGYKLFFDFNCDIFDEKRRGWFINHFLRVLDAWLDDPQIALNQIDLLSADERQHFLINFNQTQSPLPAEKNVVRLFEAQVQRSPTAIAICDKHSDKHRDGHRQLTYAQLNQRANCLAHQLVENNIGQGSLVGLFATRSQEAVVGILGALKAGAAYVPIDPEYPQARLVQMLEDSGVSVVLTQRALVERLPIEHSKIIILEDLPETGIAETGITEGGNPETAQTALVENPNIPLTDDDTAYVIFTSGSTGVPKGAQIHHKGLLNYIMWASDQYCGEHHYTFPLFSSLSFDLTVTSIFTPLVTGGGIIVYNDDEATGEAAVVQLFKEDRVDVVKLTPAHLTLLREMRLAPSRLKVMIVGGEDFKRELAKDTHDLLGGRVVIYNEYGPTETVVGCMIHRFDPQRDQLPSVPIGQPIANTQIYLLDQVMQPVPTGVIGEIYIGGAGVAHGYLNRAELTAERFVARPNQLNSPQLPSPPNGSNAAAPSRLYRTGDLGRWLLLPDRRPQLEFLGRADHQVKVRGYRIELGEIEATLLSHPNVDEVVVTYSSNQSPNESTNILKNADITHCVRCGLPSNYPEARFEAGVCHMCRDYETYREQVDRYFKDLDELQALTQEIKVYRQQQNEACKYDCMVLLSGGKDSTYMLYQVVEMGLHPLVFTLDNGFISDGAKANCRRVAEHLGLDLIFGTTPHMNTIFADSLQRFSNVCNGCFKTIYTLSMNLAREHGIRHIITGLARGQLFETRLSDMYDHQIYDVDKIDEFVLQARKAYHRMDDAVSQCLDVELFNDDRVFDEIQFVDFYRYTDVELDEMLAYLADHAPWVRPADTGRSTNCLINDAGIYVHKKEQGYHNYALPYSWDVRLGHKERDAALHELDDEIDEENVQQILNEIGYELKEATASRAEQNLVAYYVSKDTLTSAELRDFVAKNLPTYMIPSFFVELDQMPLTPNGKIDRKTLPDPRQERAQTSPDFSAARTDSEAILIEIWQEIFRLDNISIYDNFFDLGGDSIINIQIIARASQAGLHLLPRHLFEHQTISDLAAVATLDETETTPAEQGLIIGPAPLTPIQKRFFAQNHPAPHHWNQTVRLETQSTLSVEALTQALNALIEHHDALRLRFANHGGTWQQDFAETAPLIKVACIDLSDMTPAEQQETVERQIDELHQSLDLAAGKLVAAAYFSSASQDLGQIYLIIHHLVVDGVSWYPLLEDLETAYTQIQNLEPINLPNKTTSYQQWAEALQTYALQTYAQRATLKQELTYWLNQGEIQEQAFPIDIVDNRDRMGALTRGSMAAIDIRLDAETTQHLLQDAHGAYNTQINDLLLTALARTLVGWMGGRTVRIDVEGHGREDIGVGLDLSRTVGWFTSIAPIGIELPDELDIGLEIKTIKETLRGIPNRGVGYGILRYLSPDPEVEQLFAAQSSAAILFNYLGQLDQIASQSVQFKLNQELTLSSARQNWQAYPLEVNAYIIDGELHAEFTYSSELHFPQTINSLANSFLDELQIIIEHCLDPDTGGFTPSDFSLAGLDQAGLDQLTNILGG